MALIQDFRDVEPEWVWYGTLVGANAENERGTSRKYIEARVDRVDDGLFVFTRRWGGLPDTGFGQVTQKGFPSKAAAQDAAEDWVDAKTRKGYCASARPSFDGSLIALRKEQARVAEIIRKVTLD